MCPPNLGVYYRAMTTNSTSITRYTIRPWGSAFSVWNEQEHAWAAEGPMSETTANEVIDQLIADAEYRAARSPETPCARHNLGLEHDPHTIYLVSTPVGHCPGVQSM